MFRIDGKLLATETCDDVIPPTSPPTPLALGENHHDLFP